MVLLKTHSLATSNAVSTTAGMTDLLMEKEKVWRSAVVLEAGW